MIYLQQHTVTLLFLSTHCKWEFCYLRKFAGKFVVCLSGFSYLAAYIGLYLESKNFYWMRTTTIRQLINLI